MEKLLNNFEPDYAVPVGEIIEEYLQVNNIKKNTFANLIGKSPKWMSEFISGKQTLSVKTALKIEEHCPLNAKFLMRIEVNYRIFMERLHGKNNQI